jgi:dienelactone hydrolase
MTRVRLILVMGFAALLAACSNSSDGSGSGGTRGGPAPDTYRDPGPYAAGVTTLTLADRGVEVWYPVDPADTEGLETSPYFIREFLSDAAQAVLADAEERLQIDLNPPFATDAYREAPASTDGPFPLVLFSHGSPAFRTQSTFLTTHLASWGFVVASIDHLEWGIQGFLGSDPDPVMDDVELRRMVVALLDTENLTEEGLLEGVVSTEQLGVTGHSAGGSASRRFGFEPDVVTYIPLSAGVARDGTTELPDVPSLWLTGTTDGIIEPQRTIDAFEQASAPTRLVLIENMGHLGPSDICLIGDTGGGVIGLALEAGLPVESLADSGTDGCGDESLPIRDGWPVINHFVTAQLRWAFGIDEEPVGMSQEVQEFFPEATFEYDESL